MNDRIALLTSFTLLGLWSAGGSAAQWTAGGGVNISSLYTTNACRTSSDEQGQGGVTITPNLGLRGEGGRARLALIAGLQYNSLADNDLDCGTRVDLIPGAGGGVNAGRGEAESIVPRLNFTSEVNAIENFLVLEGSAFASQNAINPFTTGGDDNVNGVNNTNITYRWGVGGRIERIYKDSWRSLIRYRYNEQFNSVDTLFGDSQENRVDLNIGQLPGSQRLTFAAIGNYSEVTFSETNFRPESTNRLARIALRSVFQLDRNWRATASYGQEDNAFLSASSEIDGTYWDAGVRWAPNSRVNFEAGYGERFFGKTPRFSAFYRHKRSTFRAQYLRSLQFPRNIRGADGDFDPDDPLGPDGGGTTNPGTDAPTFVGQGPVQNEVLALIYSFSARRTRFAFNARYSEQTRSLDATQSEFINLTANATRRLGPSLSLILNGSYIQNSGVFDAEEIQVRQGRETWRGSIALNRRLANRASVFVRYEYLEQFNEVADDMSGGFNEFAEHRILLGLRFSFGRQTGRGFGGGGAGGGFGGGGFGGGVR
ncbi:MAG: TIGR03016 family PEP-CTERM system-associated outer membrane protein [Pseudomonadota bacterium]